MMAERTTYYDIRVYFINCIYSMSLERIKDIAKGLSQPNDYSVSVASYEYESAYELPVEQLMLALVELIIYSDRDLNRGAQYCREQIQKTLIIHSLNELFSDIPDEEKNTFLSDLTLLEIAENEDILQTVMLTDFKHHSATVENDGSLYTEIIHYFSEYIYAGCLEKIKLRKQNIASKLPINYSILYALENYDHVYGHPIEHLMLAIVKLVFAVDTELNSAIPQIQDEINELLATYQLDELMAELTENDRVDLSHHLRHLGNASLIVMSNCPTQK